MIRIKQAVIVEGKYDKIKLSSLLDTVIIQTDGFGIFKIKKDGADSPTGADQGNCYPYG